MVLYILIFLVFLSWYSVCSWYIVYQLVYCLLVGIVFIGYFFRLIIRLIFSCLNGYYVNYKNY